MQGRCPLCGKTTQLLFSNNPIVPSVCGTCVASKLDPMNLKQADFFCRTYNIPFDPNGWMDIAERAGDQTFEAYLAAYYDENDQNLFYKSVTADLWSEMDAEWARYKDYETAIAAIEPVKKAFTMRARAKWGANYEFEELLSLENLFVSTLRSNDISNPMQIDSIKKACRLSLEVDKAIEAGDADQIKKLTDAHAKFIKTAQIDEIITTANNDCIRTVADLAAYIEECGGHYDYYDKVPRDVVDKTIADIQTYIRTLVEDTTGLSTTLENIKASYISDQELEATEKALAFKSIDELYADTAQEFTDEDDDGSIAFADDQLRG